MHPNPTRRQIPRSRNSRPTARLSRHSPSMSNSGQRPMYPWRIHKFQQGSRPPSGHSALERSQSHRAYLQTPGGPPQAFEQPLVHSQYVYVAETSSARAMDQPSATFSRANRDRGLSNIFTPGLSDAYQRPPTTYTHRMPQSSAGYQDVPAAQDMSISEGSTTGGVYQDRLAGAYPGLSLDRAPRGFFSSHGQTPRTDAAMRRGEREAPRIVVPALHVKFRRISEALAEAGISFPSRASHLAADHAIQAVAHFYGLFLPMPPDFPSLDFTIPGAHQAAKLRRGIDAVSGLLEDLEYHDRRQTVSEMANLSLIEQPHRTVSVLFWLMELAEQARYALPKGGEEEIPMMAQSLEYAEYAVRMIFASSLSNNPEVTSPEARTCIDAALSRFQVEKEESITKYKADIKAIEEERVEETKSYEADAARLAQLQSQRAELEGAKQERTSDLASLHSTLSSLQSQNDTKAAELNLSREDFQALRAKLAKSGIESPQKALELAAQLKSKQDELERLDADFQHAQSTLASQQHHEVSQLLNEMLSLTENYNEGIHGKLVLPALPEHVDEVLGKSAAELLSAQTVLSISEQWKRTIGDEQSSVTHLEKLVTETELKTLELEVLLETQNREAVNLRVEVNKLSDDSSERQREVQQLQLQLQAREKQLQSHRSQSGASEKQELLWELTEQVKTADATNNELESKMRESANRKREIRVLLETYKAAYARIVEGIGQHESAIRQQEQMVIKLQRVLTELGPPDSKKSVLDQCTT